MKVVLCVLFILSSITYSQITTSKVSEPALEKEVTVLDSSKNHFGKEVAQYLNRKVYLNHLGESVRKYDYPNIYDYLPDSYDSDNYDYEEVAGKYYTVVDVIPDEHGYHDDQYYLKMVQDENKETYYYKYDSGSDVSFELILVDHFEWLKKNYIGERIYSKGTNPFGKKSANDYITGKTVDFSAGTEWTIKDVTIEEKYNSLAFIAVNEKGEQVIIEERWINYPQWALFGKDYDYLKNNYPDYVDKVVRGKVVIGMPKNIVVMSWGEPDKINKSLYEGGATEQWVYRSTYLYFEDGKLSGAN